MGVYGGVEPTWASQTDAGRTHIATKGIVQSGLVLNLDAGVSSSYPGSGTTWTDLSGNGNNMTLYNGVSYSNGFLDFDGTDDYAQTTSNGLTTGTNVQYSLEMWVNFDSFGPNRWWLAVIGQSSGYGSLHWIGNEATSTGDFGSWDYGPRNSPNLIGTNQWLHLVTTFTGTILTTYVNSLSGTPVSNNSFNFTNTEFTIGFGFLGESYFNGKVATSRIYNRALTAQEIQQNFNATRSRFGI